MKRLILALLIGAFCIGTVAAQTDPFSATEDYAMGQKPFGSYDGSNFDWVDLANGGVNVRIVIGSMTAKSDESKYSLMYSSKFWSESQTYSGGGYVINWQTERTTFGTSTNGPNGVGWSDSRGRMTYISSQLLCLVTGHPVTKPIQVGYVYRDDDNSKHNFPFWNMASTNATQCGLSAHNYNGPAYSSEGQLWFAAGASTLPSGVGIGSVTDSPPAVTTISTPTNYADANGNIFSETTAANGQNFLTVNSDPISSPTYGRVTSVQVLDANGILQPWTMTYNTVNVTTPKTTTLSVLTQIAQPNGKNYLFEYNGGWGDLSKITLPTGGYIRYEYTTFANSAYMSPGLGAGSQHFVSKRAISPDGTAGSEQVTTYSYSHSTPTDPSSLLTVQVTKPDGSYEIHKYQNTGSLTVASLETSVEWHSSTGTLLKTVAKTWASDFVPDTSTADANDFGDFELPSYIHGNWRVTNEVTTLDNGQQNQVNTYYDSYSYTDPNGTAITQTLGNIKKVEESDFGASAPGPIVRVTKFQYKYELNPSYLTAHLVNRIAAKWVGTPTNTFSLSETLYDTTTPTGIRGNASVSRAAIIPSGTPNPDTPPDTYVTAWRDTTNSYDSFGNVTQTVDPGGHTSTFEYAQCATGHHSATNFAITGFREEKTLNCNLGLPLTSKDINLQTTAFEYGDTLHRLTKITWPDASNITFAYNDTTLVATATQLINNGSATTLVAEHQFDKLARIYETRILGDTCGSIKHDTFYDSLGRTYQTSNPYCVSTEPTYGLTTVNYDGLDRKTKTIPPDGTVTSNFVVNSYAGNCMTVNDQASKTRKSCIDSLGRSVKVFEPDVSGSLVNETDFQYDVLGNLICVVQKGTDPTAFTNCASALATWRPRSATYDSLSRVLTATNPETGTITYKYDSDTACPTPNSFPMLLVSRTDARGIRTCYQYDAMNRMVQKNYSNGETSVTYIYDQTGCLGAASCFNFGRRTGMTDAAGSESWAYDQMGRVVKEQRTTNAVTKTTSYTYNLDGSIATVTYPSGRVITYSYDALTRPVSAVDVANSINYVTGASYSPVGIASILNGSSIVSQYYFNKRLQPCRISVKNTGTSPSQCGDATKIGNILDFNYDYSLGVSNNGQVKQISNNLNTSRTQNFTYDSLNRILNASTQATTGTYAWGLQFGYDIWGNLQTTSLTQGSAPILGITADNNNRIMGACYDLAGNYLAAVTPCPSPTYAYDAENRIKSTAGVNYTYDGDGNRVQKSNGKLYWYGSGEEILDESDASGNITSEYIFFGGKRVARRVVSPAQVQYYFADHLNSSRIVTDASGTVLDDADFYPFGGERSYTSTSGNNYKFTGKERDSESGLDDFGARYFTSQFGRFMTPDWSASPVLVPYADLGNPQTFNLYSYVANNPINGIDPDGHFRLDPPGSFIYHDPDLGCLYCSDAASSEKAAEAQNQSKHGKKPKKKKGKQQKPNKKNERNKIYNEVSGLRPKLGVTTESDRSQAVVNIAHVYNNVNGKGFQGSSGLGPQDARDVAKSGTDAAIYYQDANDAVDQAAAEPDTTQNADHFYIYDPAAINSGKIRPPAWVTQGETTTILGPFIAASGGGDIPKGDQVYVITINDRNIRNPNQ